MARKKKTVEDYIKAYARRAWHWSSQYKGAKERALIGKDASGNHLFRCEKCNLQPIRGDQKEVDHMSPVEAVSGWDGDWTAWFGRLLCPIERLMVLCLDCHHDKSAKENAERRKNKKARLVGETEVAEGAHPR